MCISDPPLARRFELTDTSDGDHTSAVSQDIPVSKCVLERRAAQAARDAARLTSNLKRPTSKLLTNRTHFTRSQRRAANTTLYVSPNTSVSPRRLSCYQRASQVQVKKPAKRSQETWDSTADETDHSYGLRSTSKKARLAAAESETDLSDGSQLSILCPASKLTFLYVIDCRCLKTTDAAMAYHDLMLS